VEVVTAIPWILERRTEDPPPTTNNFLSLPQKDPRAALRKKARDHKIIKEWRGWASEQPEALGWQTCPGVVEIEYWSLRQRAGRIDTSAPYLIGKAMVDGLVDAKFLADDQYKIVVREHLCGPVVVGYYGVRLVIREVEGVTLDLDVPRPVGRTRPSRSTSKSKTVRTPAGGITLTGGIPLVDGFDD
jgi:hypothetical protein